MSCLDNDIRNPLRRDGTCRPDRWFVALGEEFVKINERSEAELQDLAKAIASGIVFYDLNNQPNRDWSAFFDKSVPEAAPHMALFKAFLSMLAQAQYHMNTLTRAHLEYYYKTVLQLDPLEAVPDKAVVVWELAKNVQRHLLKAHTPLNADKDNTQVERLYRTERDTVLNRAYLNMVQQLTFDKYSININNSFKHFTKPFSKKLAASRADLDKMSKNGEHWPLFGKQQYNLAESDRTMDEAEFGFALAHPVLLMSEGRRLLTLTLNFPASSAFKPENLMAAGGLRAALKYYLSGAGKWLECTVNSVVANAPRTQLVIELELPLTAPAVVSFDKSGLTEPFATPYPVLKCLLNTAYGVEGAYDVFTGAKLSSVLLKVNVGEIRSLHLQNDFGVLDASKPFQPFGSQPVLGSSFKIGSAEVFRKKLSEVKLKIEWHGLPGANLNTHYNWLIAPQYQTTKGTQTKVAPKTYAGNSSFKCKLFILYDKKEWEVATNKPLFSASATDAIEISASELQTKVNGGAGYQQKWSSAPLQPFDNLTQNDFLIVELSAPNTAFGHREWPAKYAEAAILKAKHKDGEGILPNEPYTPTIKQLKLSYISTESINFNLSSQPGVFYHVMPFGVAPAERNAEGQVSLLPPNGLGHLYLGFKELTPPATLTLWLQMEEGSENPAWDIKPTDIVWSYLSGNTWRNFTGLEIFADTTLQMSASGLLGFQIPVSANLGNTLQDSSHHWLRLSLREDPLDRDRLKPHHFGKVVGIHAQVTLAEFEENNNDPDHLRYPLPPVTIKKMAIKEAPIKSIHQPYASFGGRVMEQPDDFFTRIAERVRHRDRAICIWDYERLVLERFTQIYKVKCLNTFRETSGIQPCNVTLIVLENLINRNPANPLKPLTEKRVLLQIEQFLAQRTSPWVQLAVENPIYEEVKVYCDVMFRVGFDPNYYQSQLNEELRRFLTPWAYVEGENVVFGGRIYKSSILTFIEERHYVYFVTNFRVEHIALAEGIGCMEICADFIVGDWYRSIYGEVIDALTDKSVLVSAENHELVILTENDAPCNNTTLVLYDPCVGCS